MLQQELAQATKERDTLEVRVNVLEQDLRVLRKNLVREGHRQQRRFDSLLVRCSWRMMRWLLQSWALVTARQKVLYKYSCI